MKVEQIRPTFWVPEKMVNFFGVKPVVNRALIGVKLGNPRILFYMWCPNKVVLCKGSELRSVTNVNTFLDISEF